MRPSVTAYTVSDERFFVGTVALLNSLRLVGETFPLVVLDVGLTRDQRARLEPHAKLVPVPPDAAENRMLLKAYPARLDPQGVVVVLDADMLVTAPLGGVIADAESGRVCVFTDGIETQRWFDEWYGAFGLPPREDGGGGPRHPHRTVNGGFVAFSTEHWPDLLERWWRACLAIPGRRMAGAGAPITDPFWDGDQDALNAVLQSIVPRGRLAVRRTYVTREMRHVRLALERGTAAAGGRPVGLLHSLGSPKPWQPGAWRRVRRDAYVRLLRRVLFEPDVALPLDPAGQPLWLHPTPLGGALLGALEAVNEARTLPRRARLRVRLTLAAAPGRREETPEAPPVAVP